MQDWQQFVRGLLSDRGSFQGGTAMMNSDSFPYLNESVVW